MPFAQIRDIRMYYERRGSGPRLLYISGTGGDLRAGRVFEGPLADGFDLLAYDQRGLGQTDKPDVPYTMADYAEDAAALLDHVGWDRARVIGVSFGGMVSQELAARYPERVERLVLACTSSGGAGGSSYPLHELEGLSPEEALKRRIGLYDARFGDMPREQWPASFAAIIDRAAQNRDLGADDPAKPIGAHRQLEARMAHDTYDRLHRLTMPVLRLRRALRRHRPRQESGGARLPHSQCPPPALRRWPPLHVARRARLARRRRLAPGGVAGYATREAEEIQGSAQVVFFNA